MSNESKSHHHVLPIKVYLAVGAALLTLTIITVELSFVHFGAFNLVVALFIASSKALLVAFFFMHLWYDHKIYFIAFTVGLLILTVFIVLTLFDTMDRGAIYDFKQDPIKPNAAMYDAPPFKGGSPTAHGQPAPKDTTKAKADSSAMKAPADTAKTPVSGTH